MKLLKNFQNKQARTLRLNKQGYDSKRLYFKIIIVTITLALLGCLFIYSASNYSAEITYSDSFFYVKKQLIALVLGIIAMLAVSRIELIKLNKLTFVFPIIGTVLLALVFIPQLGVESYGAKRWLNMGFFTIQPSEIAKLFFVLFSALWLSKHSEGKLKDVLPVLIMGGITAALIMLEPNMSITICVALATLLMLFLGGVKIKSLVFAFIPLAVLAVIFIAIEPYRVSRIIAYVDPFSNPTGEGYQLIQSFYALASGGWFGVGLFNSRQKYLFLPFSESDFIFSIIGEEIGFIGALAVLGLYLYFIVLGIRVCALSKNKQEYLISGGIVGLIAIQLVLNIAVVTGSIPPTGLPLPFMSAGGSSLVVLMASVGILLSILRANYGKVNNIVVKHKM